MLNRVNRRVNAINPAALIIINKIRHWNTIGGSPENMAPVLIHST